MAASAPASEAVWLSARAAPASERPALTATIGFLAASAFRGRGIERGDVVDRLDVQADRGDARVVDQGGDAVRQADLGLIAERHQMADRQAAPLHGEVEADIAGLGQDGDAALAAPAAMLVEPEQGAVEIVDDAVAVGAEDRHVARGLDQRRLQLHAAAADSRKPGGVADRAAGADRRRARGRCRPWPRG